MAHVALIVRAGGDHLVHEAVAEVSEALEGESGLSHHIARAIAGTVEERVLRMNCRRIICTLVHEMVVNELWAMRQVENALAEQEREVEKYAGCPMLC